jgi:hypothetical protein
MIGAMIWALAVGCILLMGIAYTAVMAITAGPKIVRTCWRGIKRLIMWRKGYRRLRFEPTEQEDYTDGQGDH